MKIKRKIKMKKLNELLEAFQSAVLGTQSENAYPFSSYAPFYYDGEVVYVFLSNIATHAQNMQERPKASAFFVDDEVKSENIFARRRISLQCDVQMINREDRVFDEIMKNFQAKFEGGTLAMLMGMQDFNLYALTPIYGEATFGFGEAYNIGGEKMNELVERTGKRGHK
jgi:putative heme iron utilization protein